MWASVFLWRVMKIPFAELNKKDWTLYILSLTVVVGSNLFSDTIDAFSLISTVIGVTALIFIAKGNVWGQIFSLLFAVLYGITSYKSKYYGEVFICLLMTIPLSIFSIIVWIKNPFEKGKNVVKIRILTVKEVIITIILASVVTVVFYFILRAFNTPNLIVSTISICTSFLASYLMLRRNSYYAIAYTLNDIVLIILWTLASIENLENLPVVACFSMFLFNDLYAFFRWKAREKEQNTTK